MLTLVLMWYVLFGHLGSPAEKKHSLTEKSPDQSDSEADMWLQEPTHPRRLHSDLVHRPDF